MKVAKSLGSRAASNILLAILAVGILMAPIGVNANHAPANKVVAAGSKAVESAPGERVELLKASIKTSGPTDLILALSLECTILTGLVTGPSEDGGATDSATATGRVVAWIEIDDKIVPINSISSSTLTATPSQGGEADKVTFCDRTYSRTVTDGEDPLDGLDEENDYIRTKSSHAFNWLRLNLGSGPHKIVVYGTLTKETVNDATAEAIVGNRTLIVLPEKLANDASI